MAVRIVCPATGFVVFRFYEVKEKGEKKLVPLVVPISEIQWVFEKHDMNYEFDVFTYQKCHSISKRFVISAINPLL